jgi:oligopeptide/dipeptide ABC transporter ATP-binding protein
MTVGESALLELDGLRTGLATRGADAPGIVEDVSFAIGEGEILGIVGESGSGKTLTALSIMGLLPAALRVTSGRVSLQGRDLLALRERELNQVRGRQISMVFQNPRSSLNPLLKVRVTLDQALRAHTALGKGERAERSVELLGHVGLPNPAGVLERYPHELSGGMCQRVMIALALSSEPALLIADEPTTALDVTIQLQILVLLARLRDERGLAQIVITHNLGVVAELCDRVLVMYAGRVVEEGPVATIFAEPRHPYTRALLASRPRMGGAAFATIPGQVPDLDSRPQGCSFHPRCAYAQAVCQERVPPLDPVAPGHRSACLFAKELP